MIRMIVKTIDKPKTPYIPTSISVAVFPSTTNACALLNQFKPEKNQGEEMRQKVKENGKAQALLKVFEKGVAMSEAGMCDDPYETATKALRRFKITENDIHAFLHAASKIPPFNLIGSHMGNFLSVLINQCVDDDLHISLEPFPFKLSEVGVNNTKKVTIYGDLGNCIALSMSSGEFTVYGNVEAVADRLEGGKVIVYGNVHGFGARDLVGDEMSAGEIIINGNINHSSEYIFKFPHMYGGKIRVNGKIHHPLAQDTRQVSKNSDGGNLFQYDRQLFKDGKRTGDAKNK